MSQKEYTLSDGKRIFADDSVIDVSDMNFFDELVYDSWNLFLNYCDAIGIEVKDREEPDWDTALRVQDQILNLIVESGISLNFDNTIEEDNETEMGMTL